MPPTGFLSPVRDLEYTQESIRQRNDWSISDHVVQCAYRSARANKERPQRSFHPTARMYVGVLSDSHSRYGILSCVGSYLFYRNILVSEGAQPKLSIHKPN